MRRKRAGELRFDKWEAVPTALTSVMDVATRIIFQPMTLSNSVRPFPNVDGAEVTHRYVDVNGLKIHVAEAGEGEPLFMYHGWPQHWWMWHQQIPFFAKRFRVIVPDM